VNVQTIGAARLRENVGLEDMLDPVSRALQATSAGNAKTGLVVMYPHPDRARGDVLVKTGTVAGSAIHIIKVSPWFAANVERGMPQGGFVAVMDSETGHTLALLHDEHYLSDIRTAAAGALAARILAPRVVRTAGVLGAGVQAWWQAIALYRERPFVELLLWARDGAKTARLAAKLERELRDVDVQVLDDRETVVRRSDVLVTATAAREPIVRGDWLHAGQHITAVGADDATKCELDSAVLRRATVFVDGIGEATAHGDVRRAIDAGSYEARHLRGELGAVLAGTLPGRTSDDEITVAKLVGVGAQDIAAALVAITKCRN